MALQFANTVNDRGKTRTREGLPSWSLLLDWAQTAELVSASECAALADQGETETELERLHVFRETICRSFPAVAAGTTPAEADLAALTVNCPDAVALARLAPVDEALVWQVEVADTGVATVRARLALATLSLAADSGALARLRECGGCTTLFLDTGRGRGRRRCRMETCGNRDKVARHRGRTG